MLMILTPLLDLRSRFVDDEVPGLLPLELSHLVGREGGDSVAERPELQKYQNFVVHLKIVAIH